METYFAPAPRTDRRKFKNQIQAVSQNPLIDSLLDTITGLMVVLNEDRQIIAINHTFLNSIGINNADEVLGLRLGESLSCTYADNQPNGCGTTLHCRTCGAAIAMMAAIDENKTEEQICIISRDKKNADKDISLLVKAQPFFIEENKWVLIFAQDITKQQFWTSMEHFFYHDLNNMVGALIGMSEILLSEQPDNHKVRSLHSTSERLCTEINLQKDLWRYKDVQHITKYQSVSLNDIRKELSLILTDHKVLKDKQIEENWPQEEINLSTDLNLITRILQNMVINALEATEKGGTIKVSAFMENDGIRWEVWNRSGIPEDFQLRIFQKHYSTKNDIGRGLGTYSMKLIGEDYLKGKVYFESSKEKGTKFVFKLPF